MHRQIITLIMATVALLTLSETPSFGVAREVDPKKAEILQKAAQATDVQACKKAFKAELQVTRADWDSGCDKKFGRKQEAELHGPPCLSLCTCKDGEVPENFKGRYLNWCT